MRSARGDRLLISVLVLVLGATALAHGQSRDYYELVQRFQQPQIYSESLVLPGRDSSAHVGVTFRLPHPLLVFHQTGSRGGERAFQASVQVLVEVREDGETVAERSWSRTHTATDYEATRDQETDIEGGVWFELPPGDYRYRLEVTDRNAEQSASSGARSLTVPAPNSGRIGPAVLARSVNGGADRIEVTPANLSGDVAFGEPAYAVVPIWSDELPAGDSAAVTFELRDAENTGRRRRTVAADEELFDFGDEASRRRQARGSAIFRPPHRGWDERSETSAAGSGEPVRSGRLVREDLVPIARVAGRDSTSSRFVIDRAVSFDRAEAFAAVIDLRGERLENGSYVLSFQRPESDTTGSRTAPFASYWREMPYSLYNLDVAIDHLSYIVPEDTLERIAEGDRSAKKRKFQAFWSRRDPDPETPYNPLMAEYYRRIDHAADEFRTGLSPAPNGLETDRGRIYIVHGAPDETERNVPRRGTVRETWTYEDGRTFVFEASSSLDTFELVRTPG